MHERKTTEDFRNGWKACAEKMGYHCAENTDPTLPFDGLMYRETVMVAVRLKKPRYGIGDNCIIEQKFPDDLRHSGPPAPAVRAPQSDTDAQRAGVPTVLCSPRHHRGDRGDTKEGYRNTHFREAYWKKAPFRIVIPLRKEEGGKTEVKKALYGLRLPKRTIRISGWSGNGVHAREKVRGKERFLKTVGI